MTETDIEDFISESYECVWDALCDRSQDANEMCARSELMRAVLNIIKDSAWKPAEAARRAGVPLPRMQGFLKGRFNKFSLSDLLDMAASLGYRPLVTLQKRSVL